MPRAASSAASQPAAKLVNEERMLQVLESVRSPDGLEDWREGAYGDLASFGEPAIAWRDMPPSCDPCCVLDNPTNKQRRRGALDQQLAQMVLGRPGEPVGGAALGPGGAAPSAPSRDTTAGASGAYGPSDAPPTRGQVKRWQVESFAIILRHLVGGGAGGGARPAATAAASGAAAAAAAPSTAQLPPPPAAPDPAPSAPSVGPEGSPLLRCGAPAQRSSAPHAGAAHSLPQPDARAEPWAAALPPPALDSGQGPAPCCDAPAGGAASGLGSCPHVVDFGCGTGSLMLPLAAAFPHCRFTGVEMKPAAVAILRERARAAGLSNVEAVEGMIEDYAQPFHVGMALHACGNATDAAMLLAAHHRAACIVSPCCVGKLKFSLAGGSSFHPHLRTYTPSMPGERPVGQRLRAAAAEAAAAEAGAAAEAAAAEAGAAAEAAAAEAGVAAVAAVAEAGSAAGAAAAAAAEGAAEEAAEGAAAAAAAAAAVGAAAAAAEMAEAAAAEAGAAAAAAGPAEDAAAAEPAVRGPPGALAAGGGAAAVVVRAREGQGAGPGAAGLPRGSSSAAGTGAARGTGAAAAAAGGAPQVQGAGPDAAGGDPLAQLRHPRSLWLRTSLPDAEANFRIIAKVADQNHSAGDVRAPSPSPPTPSPASAPSLAARAAALCKTCVELDRVQALVEAGYAGALLKVLHHAAMAKGDLLVGVPRGVPAWEALAARL